jgi:Helix-turn-helix.
MKKNRTDKRMKALSEKIRMLRVQKNLTQKQLAEALKLSPQSISGYENGNVIPDILCLFAYAEYFEVSVNDLLNLHNTGDSFKEDMPSSSEMQMIESYRRRPEWMKKVIRTLCFNGGAYRSLEEEHQEMLALLKLEEEADAAKKK